MTKNICLLSSEHNSTDSQDTGALVKSGRSHVRERGNKNIMFTIITAPEWAKRTHWCYHYQDRPVLKYHINGWPDSGSEPKGENKLDLT